MGDFEISESARYGAALTIGPAASYSHHSGRYQIQLSGHGFEASHFLSEDDLRELRDWINAEIGDDRLEVAAAALKGVLAHMPDHPDTLWAAAEEAASKLEA